MSETRGLELDPACPIDWTHPLNVGLVADWTITPNSGWRGGLMLRDLVRGGRNPHDGTRISSPVWSGAKGRKGGNGSLTFTSQYVDTGYTTPTWPLTFSAWYQRNSDGANYPGILSSGREAGGSTTTPGFGIYQATDSTHALYTEAMGATASLLQVYPGPDLSADVLWHHCVATCDGSSLSLYMDGRLVGSATGTAGAYTATQTTRIGCRSVGEAAYLNGSVDGAIIHARILSAGEIAALYQETARGNPDRYRWLRPWSLGVTVAGGGGTPNTQTNTGSCTPAGALVKAVAKALAGASTGVGALAKAASKPGLVGSATGAGACVRATAKSLAGSSTGAGALAKACAKHPSGSVTGTGGLVKAVAKPLAGSCTGVGALAKAVAKPLAGSSTGAGGLAKAAAKPLTGSCTGAAALTKAVAKGLTGATTGAGGSLAKQTSKTATGSVAASGALGSVRAKLQSLAGAVIAAGSLARAVAKYLIGFVSGSGALTTEGGSEPPTTPPTPPRPAAWQLTRRPSVSTSLIREPALKWAAGQSQSVWLTPLLLPTGRALADFSAFTLTIRADPKWPRSGADAAAAGSADPIADGWAVALTSAGTLIDGTPVFQFVVPAPAGVKRYAVDVWAALSSGGEVQLVEAQWLTAGGRVE